jgi:hypothetical protein
MAFATLGSIHSNLTKNKPISGTALNTELIVNGMFNSYTLAGNTLIQVSPTVPDRSTFKWAIQYCSTVSGNGNYSTLCNSSIGSAGGALMYETPLSRGLNTGGSNYNYIIFQNYNTSQTNTCSQTISNMSAGTYRLSLWITPRKGVYYFSTQTGNVTIGGTPVITWTAFTNNGTTTPWSNLTGTYTLSAGNAGSKVLAMNFMNTSATNDTTVFISTVSLKRTA